MTPQRPTLLAFAIGPGEPPQKVARRIIDEDRGPDTLRIGVELNAVTLSDPATRPSGWYGRLLAAAPPAVAETWLRRRELGVVVSWGDDVAFAVAALICAMRVFRVARPGHIAILMMPFNRVSPSPIKRVLRQVLVALVVRGGMDRLDVPAPVQRKMARDRWRLPAARFLSMQWPVDTRFWRPIDRSTDCVCAVGRERRDYATLIEALRPLNIPCHIAAGTAINYGGFGTEDPDAENVGDRELPSTVTVGAKSHADLRDLYARSRAVVVPLVETNSDNGVSTIIEAMAMGRAVITTATEGRTEILEHEVNCLLVPPRDIEALRSAILRLWHDPQLAARLGEQARARVCSVHGLDVWLETMLTGVAGVSAPIR